jgi:hypothetical protein
MDKLIKERFINEARSAAALDHANLCTVHEIGESEHGVFLAMPLYPGETLKDRLAREGALPPDEALSIVQQITTGLSSAHAAGIVHRDLKPGNIMLLPDGTVKVLDFGLAKIRDISLTMSHTTVGTISYVSPEQIRGSRVDARADLWSIGVMLYEMLTGNLPFRGEHELSILHNILHADAPLPSQVNRQLPVKLDELIGALLQKDPAARYPSADALLADITALRSGAPLSHRSPFWARTAGRRRVRTSWLPIAGGVAGLIAIAALSWITYRERTAASNAAGPAVKFVNNVATISTSAELVAALSPANAGRRVHLRAGTYDIERPLTVPDGMTLEGEGVIIVAPQGYATGFRDGGRTTLRMRNNAGGDILALGNSVTLRNLEIVDLAGRSGNIIGVESRHAADTISATIIESVLVNPNALTIGASGALGRGLHIITRNANLGDAPPPDEGSVLSVKLLRSVIKSPAGGGGFFAFNLAANSKIALDISHSLIGGSSEANGGVSRPESVHDSEVRITSQNTVYRNEWKDPCAAPVLGWNLTGGSGAPIPMPLPETARNTLIVRSLDDRIDGFSTAVLATGGRRFFGASLNAAPKDNYIDLQLTGTTISTPVCTVTTSGPEQNTSGIPLVRDAVIGDFRLAGAWTDKEGIDAGNGNRVRVELRNVTASGARDNLYANAADAFGSLPARLQGKGNRLEIVGDPAAFARTNHRIDPIPPAEFFTNSR